MLIVRISGTSLDNEHFLEFVQSQFDKFALAHASICFVMTEATAITNLTRALIFINALKAHGCRFALDDFGSGMSSFAYLKHLHVDYLKIDGSYIKGLTSDPVDYAKVEAIERIATVMGLKTIAQQVNDAETLSQIRNIGVHYAQGAAIASAVPFYPTSARTSSNIRT